MKKSLILTHFFEPEWAIVNKINTIAKSSSITPIHCPTTEILEETLSKIQSDSRVLFFSDEGLISYVQSLCKNNYEFHFEIALFIDTKIESVANSVSEIEQVKYLIGKDQNESFGRDLAILIKKFKNSDILDLEKYLSFGADVHRTKIYNSKQKHDSVAEIFDFISGWGDPGYSHPYDDYARKVSEVTDELILNAIFNANPRLKSADRSLEFILSEAECVDVAWGFDGEVFGVSVKDYFGKFNRETVMQYISAQRHFDDVTGNSSAGLGLKLILERTHNLITNVEVERTTEVLALVRFDARNRKFEKRKKSVYYFSVNTKKIS